MNVRVLVINALIAALYFVLTVVSAPFSFTLIQFRISALFNHLVIFDKRYFFGIVIGVFFTNLILSPTKVDILFGLSHTILSLVITMIFARYIKHKLTLMVINSIVFSFNMFIVAYMLKVFVGLEQGFFYIWSVTGAGELITMLIAIPVVILLNKKLKFSKLI